MTEKITKNDADYSKGMAARHCGKMFPRDVGYCKNFMDTGPGHSGECELVKGEIRRSFWCRKWAKGATK